MQNKFRVRHVCIPLFFIFLLVANISGYYASINAQEGSPTLFIYPEDGYVLDENQKFSILITENTSDGDAVEGVSVAIQNVMGDKYDSTTNSDGRAFLYAPKNREKFTIIATKSGYITATETLEINQEQGIINQIIGSQYFIVFLAFLFLILAIIIVNYRQKKSVYNRAKNITKDKKMKEYGLEKKEETLYPIEKNRNNKIEEIRIVQTRQKKDVIPIEKKDESGGSIDEEKKSGDWFKGTDEVKYEIDRLTGEVDEDGEDKWFEGVENLRDKLDEKMKKKGKKEEEEDGKEK